MKHTCKTVISCIKKGIKYTGRNAEKKNGRPYLLLSSYEINLLENSMQNRLGLSYTTLVIHCHFQIQCENTVSRSTVNLAIRRLLTKISKIQKIKQGTKNEGKWKESRY